MNSKKFPFAVIGCGNMASAIIEGVARKSHPFDFYTYTPTFTKAKVLADSVKGVAVQKIDELKNKNFYMLGFKPQQLKEVTPHLKSIIPSDGLVISLLASISTTKLIQELAIKKVVRIMTNTPALVGKGATLIFFSNHVTEDEKKIVREMFTSVGEVFELQDEGQIDILTCVNGSGPAYVFELARIISSFLEQKGIEKGMARQIVQQTFLGASELMKNSKENLTTLRENVTSKGGITYEVLHSLDQSEFEKNFKDALTSGYKRTLELGQ